MKKKLNIYKWDQSTIPFIFSALLCLLTINNLQAQWITSGSDIYYNTGNVGIGTTSPSEILELEGLRATIACRSSSTSSFGRFASESDNNFRLSLNNDFAGGVGFNRDDTALAAWGIRMDARSNQDEFGIYRIPPGGINPKDFVASTMTLLRITKDGDVGIGLTSPSYKLDVNGSVASNGTVLTSDKRFKTDIQRIDNALSKVLSINGYTYKFKTEEFKDRNFDENYHFGVIAQELEDQFPELVYTRNDGYKAVDYMGLIPILLEAIKEQNIDIQNLKLSKGDNNNKHIITNINTNAIEDFGAKLYQNSPNPFHEETTIKYDIGSNNFQSASILVFDMNGILLRTYPISSESKALTINGSELNAGMYIYTLVVNNEEMDTKRMILLK